MKQRGYIFNRLEVLPRNSSKEPCNNKNVTSNESGLREIFLFNFLAFEEVAERILFQLQKADGDFYSVQFASKGTKQITGIYKEAKEQVDQGVVDFGRMLALLKEAGAPGI